MRLVNAWDGGAVSPLEPVDVIGGVKPQPNAGSPLLKQGESHFCIIVRGGYLYEKG